MELGRLWYCKWIVFTKEGRLRQGISVIPVTKMRDVPELGSLDKTKGSMYKEWEDFLGIRSDPLNPVTYKHLINWLGKEQTDEMTMKRIDYLMQNEKDLNNMTYEEREITTSAKKLGETWTKMYRPIVQFLLWRSLEFLWCDKIRANHQDPQISATHLKTLERICTK